MTDNLILDNLPTDVLHVILDYVKPSTDVEVGHRCINLQEISGFGAILYIYITKDGCRFRNHIGMFFNLDRCDCYFINGEELSKFIDVEEDEDSEDEEQIDRSDNLILLYELIGELDQSCHGVCTHVLNESLQDIKNRKNEWFLGTESTFISNSKKCKSVDCDFNIWTGLNAVCIENMDKKYPKLYEKVMSQLSKSLECIMNTYNVLKSESPEMSDSDDE